MPKACHGTERIPNLLPQRCLRNSRGQAQQTAFLASKGHTFMNPTCYPQTSMYVARAPDRPVQPGGSSNTGRLASRRRGMGEPARPKLACKRRMGPEQFAVRLTYLHHATKHIRHTRSIPVAMISWGTPWARLAEIQKIHSKEISLLLWHAM